MFLYELAVKKNQNIEAPNFVHSSIYAKLTDVYSLKSQPSPFTLKFLLQPTINRFIIIENEQYTRDLRRGSSP